MANIDNTPPRIRLLATIVAISVMTLIGLKFVFDSYFIATTEQAVAESRLPVHDEVAAQREAEAKALGAAAVPLDQAMARVAKGDRTGIEAQPSDDTGSLSGWSKLPKPVPSVLHAAPTLDAGATADAGDDAGDAGDAGTEPPGHAMAADAGHPAAHTGPGTAPAPAPKPEPAPTPDPEESTN